MKLSEEQEMAINDILSWCEVETSPKRHYRLFGYAGTGKTSIAKTIAERHGGNVIFGAFTGKAAHVLRSKGCKDACTLHSLIYKPTEKCKERMIQLQLKVDRLSRVKDPTEKQTLELERLLGELSDERENVLQPGFSLNLQSELLSADLLIIDESSMIGKDLGSHLASFNVPMLALGDPAQLPPVKADYFFRQTDPDWLLTEIHRQALESPVLSMATDVRSGKPLRIGEYGESFVRNKKDVPRDAYLEADMVLVGRNETRHRINDTVRYHRFEQKRKQSWDGEPFIEGEKLVCLKNNKELELMNGAIYTVEEVKSSSPSKTKAVLRSEDTNLTVTTEVANDIFYGANIFDCEQGLTYFDYGYALTCHKSQGSQWNNVIVIDESSCFRSNATNWLYTAITRASEKVGVVVS